MDFGPQIAKAINPQVTRLTKLLSGKSYATTTMPSKDLAGNAITSSEQLLSSWNEFLKKKFAEPGIEKNRAREQTVCQEDHIGKNELEDCLKYLKTDRAPGWDKIPIEAYQQSASAESEFFRIVYVIWDCELLPSEIVRGIFIML